MSIDPLFETISPGQIIIFKSRNPVDDRHHLYTQKLLVTVLDSPVAAPAADGLPKIRAMIVPDQRETDWNFCTESGQLHLLLNFRNVSRLILISNNLAHDPQPPIYIRPPAIDPVEKWKLEYELQPLVTSLHPTVCFENGAPRTRFLPYVDDLMYRVIIGRFQGPFVGEFIVEDVQIEGDGDSADIKLLRILRFKRMPNFVQSQVFLHPVIDDGIVDATGLNLESLREMENVEFEANTVVFVHPYLTAMVSGLSLVGSHLNEQVQLGFTPRALCLGVGGGVLLSFLNNQLGFEVVGVEADQFVLNAANQYFGLVNDEESIQIIVGDAIDLIKTVEEGHTSDSDSEILKFDGLDAKFDVVMVDFSCATRYGICSPPREFVRNRVFRGVRLLLHNHGALIINVVPPDDAFYSRLIDKLKPFFYKVYRIEIVEMKHYVFMAIVSPPSNAFLDKLRYVLPPGDYEASFVEV